MRANVERIAPQVAAKMLMHNTDNRPIRRTVVENYKEAYGRGEYVLSHQGIAFDTRGVLADGQHRLTAIAEMPTGFAVDMLVCRDVPVEARNVMDIGYRRTASDILHEDRKLVETARFLAIVHSTRSNGITPTFLVPFVDRLREPHTELLAFCPSTVKMWGSAPMRAAVCMVEFADGDVDYAKLVYRALVHHDFSTMPRCAQSVFRSHLQGRVRASQSLDTFVRALRIFNPANANNTKVQVKDISASIELVREIIRREVFGAEEPQVKSRSRSAARAGGYALASI